MQGFIYDYRGERNPSQWLKTTKEIVLYVGRNYQKYTTELTKAVEELELMDPVAPARPDDPGDQFEMEDWKLDNKEYREKLKTFSFT